MLTRNEIKEIKALVRNHIAMEIEEDINGGEHLMKEVWEELEGDEQYEVAEQEMRRIVAYLRTK